jgi:methyl-accepting chemotaxis protein/DNA-binding LacI/PurR family transcriptional regulator
LADLSKSQNNPSVADNRDKGIEVRMNNFNSSDRVEKKRPTIATLLSYDFTMSFHQNLLAGVRDVAEANNVNFMCILNHLVWHSQEKIENNFAIYQQINPQTIDGLISQDMGMPWVQQHMQHFMSRPNIVFNYPTPKLPCLSIDNEGMRFNTDHLIETHGFKKILFISATKDNPEGNLRLQAYRKSLEQHQIPYDQNLVFYGDFGNPNSGELVIDEALRKGVKFQGVICANDGMAMGAIRGLVKHGLKVPYDVAVCGFDDEITGKSSLPPLTTIRASFYGLTKRAAELVIDKINGKSIPNGNTLFPTELVVRRSCGCSSNSISSATDTQVTQKKAGSSKSTHNVLTTQTQLFDHFRLLTGSISDQLPKGWEEALCQAFLEEVKHPSQKVFIPKLDELARATLQVSDQLNFWQDIISSIRFHYLPGFNWRPGMIRRAENLLGQGRILIAELSEQKETRRKLDEDSLDETLQGVVQEIISSFNMQDLLDVISTQLTENLGIPSLYLVLFDSAEWPARYSKLVLSTIDKKRKVLPLSGLQFETNQILPDNFLPTGRRLDLVYAPLTFKKENLGYMVFEMGPKDGLTYSILAKQISSAIKGAILLDQKDDLMQHINESAEQVTKASIRLTEIVNGTREAMIQITKSMNQVALGATEQASVVNKAVVSIDLMNTTSQKIATEAKAGNQFAAQAARDAKSGADLGDATVTGMQEIKIKVDIATQKVKDMSTRSLQISSIVETIEDLAAQTNMLALNAAIEAARAGEQGRGFAIVAAEVRKLAEKSANSTKEIITLINTIQQSITEAVKAMEVSNIQVSSGAARANESNESMYKIKKAADSLYQRVSEINEAASNIALRANEMTSSIEEIASVTEENTAATEEVNASAEEVNSQMEEMALLTQAMMTMARAMHDLVRSF